MDANNQSLERKKKQNRISTEPKILCNNIPHYSSKAIAVQTDIIIVDKIDCAEIFLKVLNGNL